MYRPLLDVESFSTTPIQVKPFEVFVSLRMVGYRICREIPIGDKGEAQFRMLEIKPEPELKDGYPGVKSGVVAFTWNVIDFELSDKKLLLGWRWDLPKGCLVQPLLRDVVDPILMSLNRERRKFA